jgi:outer membrane protein TolC
MVSGFPALAQMVIHPQAEWQQRASSLKNRPPSYGEQKLPDLKEKTSLREVMRYAYLSSPEIRTPYNEWLAAIEHITQSGALPDPSLSIGLDVQYLLGFDPLKRLGVQHGQDVIMRPEEGESMRSKMSEHPGSGRLVDALQFGFEQKIPGRGKRPAQADKAELEARAACQRFWYAQRELRRNVIGAYAELLYNHHRIDVEEENLALMQEINEIALRQLSAGTGADEDVLKNEVSITEAETELRAAKIDERRLRGSLNATIGRRADAEIGKLSDVEADWKPQPTSELVCLAVQTNPELHALAAEFDARGVQVTLAQLEHNPDFTFGTSIRAMEQMLMAGISLPLNSERIDSGINEAIARQAAQQTRYTAAVYSTLARLVTAQAALEDADRILEDYGQRLIPQYQKLWNVQLQNYGAGQGAYLGLLDTERSIIQTKRLVIHAQPDKLKALGDIEFAVGKSLVNIKDIKYSQEKFSTAVTSTNAIEATPAETLIEIPMDQDITIPQTSFEQTTSTADRMTTSPAGVKASPKLKTKTPVLPQETRLPHIDFTPAAPSARESGTTVGLVLPAWRQVFGL